MANLPASICGARDTSTGEPCTRTVALGALTCGYHRVKTLQHAPSRSTVLTAHEQPTIDFDDLNSSSPASRLWHEFYWDSHQSAREWSRAFPDYDEGIEWNIEGFTPSEALLWKERGFGPESGAWADVVGRDNPEQALKWLRIKGMTPSMAARLQDEGLSPESAACRYAAPGVPSPDRDIERWMELLPDDLTRARQWAEFAPTYEWGLCWYRQGWTVHEAMAWSHRGFNADATEWLEAVVSSDPDAAWHWSGITGMTPTAARKYIERGCSPERVALDRGVLLDIT